MRISLVNLTSQNYKNKYSKQSFSGVNKDILDDARNAKPENSGKAILNVVGISGIAIAAVVLASKLFKTFHK